MLTSPRGGFAASGQRGCITRTRNTHTHKWVDMAKARALAHTHTAARLHKKGKMAHERTTRQSASTHDLSHACISA